MYNFALFKYYLNISLQILLCVVISFRQLDNLSNIIDDRKF